MGVKVICSYQLGDRIDPIFNLFEIKDFIQNFQNSDSRQKFEVE